MKILLLSLFFCLATLTAGYGGGIIILDENNFDQVLHLFRFVMVKFYIPGCISCTQFSNEYAKAAQKLAINNPQIKFFGVDGSTEASLVSRFNVQKFPTTLLFIAGAKGPIEYKGTASADEISEWVKSKATKTADEIQSLQEIQEKGSKNEYIGIFTGPADSKAYGEYLETARNIDEITFFSTNNDKLRAEFEVQAGEEAFVLMNKNTGGNSVYKGTMHGEGLLNFIKRQKSENILFFNEIARERIFEEGEDAMFFFRNRKNANTEEEKSFIAAAHDLKKNITMIIVNFEDDIQIHFTDIVSVPLNHLFAVHQDELPALRIVQPRNRMRRFLFEGDISEQSVKKFYEDYENDKLKRLYVSASVPHDSYDGDVRVLVGKNFRDVVLDEDQNVLVLFCNHNYFICRNFESMYADVASKVKAGAQNVTVAKIDTSANEIEGVRLNSTLDIKLYPRGRKSEPIDYSGGDDERMLISFIEENISRT